MLRMRFAIFLMVAFSVLLLGTAAAQGPMGGDAGQYLILNAQYGSERSHVDVTERLKMLARQDRPFRISDESMAACSTVRCFEAGDGVTGEARTGRAAGMAEAVTTRASM